MLVYARDKDRVRRGVLPVVEAEAILRESATGTWVMTVDGDDEVSELFDPGWGIIVEDDGKTVFSGPAIIIEVEPAGDGINLVLYGVTDNHILDDRLIYPDPTRGGDQQTTAAYYYRTGSAKQLMADVVNLNAGPGSPFSTRRMPGLLAPDGTGGTGVTSSINARFTVLGDEVRRLALEGGYVVETVQGASTDIVMTFRQPTDRSSLVRFTPENGLDDYRLRLVSPTATMCQVGGSGEGTARVFKTYLRSTATWNRRVEVFQDRRDTAETTELSKSARETLDESAESASASLTLSETPDFRFLVDFNLGDRITVAIPGTEIVDAVRTADIRWDEFDRTVKLTVGRYGSEDDQAPAWVKKIKQAQQAIRNLEVNP